MIEFEFLLLLCLRPMTRVTKHGNDHCTLNHISYVYVARVFVAVQWEGKDRTGKFNGS